MMKWYKPFAYLNIHKMWENLDREWTQKFPLHMNPTPRRIMLYLFIHGRKEVVLGFFYVVCLNIALTVLMTLCIGARLSSSSSQSVSVAPRASSPGFVVMETNFRVLAYTGRFGI